MDTNQKQSFRNSVTLGEQIENGVSKWLIKQGLTLITSRFRTKEGEIDLIMQEGDCLVFVEVRYRKVGNYGNALETIDHRKCQKIIKTAQYYLQQNGYQAVDCRFDAVVITGKRFEWIKNAFDLDCY